MIPAFGNHEKCSISQPFWNGWYYTLHVYKYLLVMTFGHSSFYRVGTYGRNPCYRVSQSWSHLSVIKKSSLRLSSWNNCDLYLETDWSVTFTQLMLEMLALETLETLVTSDAVISSDTKWYCLTSQLGMLNTGLWEVFRQGGPMIELCSRVVVFVCLRVLFKYPHNWCSRRSPWSLYLQHWNIQK